MSQYLGRNTSLLTKGARVSKLPKVRSCVNALSSQSSNWMGVITLHLLSLSDTISRYNQGYNPPIIDHGSTTFQSLGQTAWSRTNGLAIWIWWPPDGRMPVNVELKTNINIGTCFHQCWSGLIWSPIYHWLPDCHHFCHMVVSLLMCYSPFLMALSQLQTHLITGNELCSVAALSFLLPLLWGH